VIVLIKAKKGKMVVTPMALHHVLLHVALKTFFFAVTYVCLLDMSRHTVITMMEVKETCAHVKK
jgi:hypothetical protein